jgi:hypothetical protein
MLQLSVSQAIGQVLLLLLHQVLLLQWDADLLLTMLLLLLLLLLRGVGLTEGKLFCINSSSGQQIDSMQQQWYLHAILHTNFKKASGGS